MRSRWLWGAWIISALVACGRTSSHDELVGDESPGTAGTTDAGAGVAGTGEEPRGGSGSGGAAGSAGAGPLTEPDPTEGCQDELFRPACRDGSCSIVYSQGLRCAGRLLGLQAADAAFMMQTTSPAATQVFNLHFEGGLVLGDSFMGEAQRWLVSAPSGPIVLEQAKPGLVATPSSLVFPEVSSTLEIAADGEDIYVLSHPAEQPRQVDLWRGNESTGVERLFSYPDAEAITFIRGLPKTSLAVLDLDTNPEEGELWKGTDIELWPLLGATVRAAKRLDELVYVDHGHSGSSIALTESQTLLTLGQEWPRCDMTYQAIYPDVCETNRPPLHKGQLDGQVELIRSPGQVVRDYAASVFSSQASKLVGVA